MNRDFGVNFRIKRVIYVLLMLCVCLLSFTFVRKMNIANAEEQEIAVSDFFEVDNGTIDVTDSDSGIKIDFKNVKAPTTTLHFRNCLSVSELKNAISFRLLNEANEMPVEWIHVVLRDYEDPTRLVNIIVNKSTAWDDTCPSTKGVVSLLDTEYIDMFSTSGRLGLKGKSGTQVVGLDDWQGTGYTIKGAFNIGYWNQYGPYLWSATGETIAMTFGIENNVVKVKGANDAIIADLTNADFLAKSVVGLNAEKDADIIAKYQNEYVSNIFSSGKATVEVTFGAKMNNADANLTDFGINIVSIGSVNCVFANSTDSNDIYKGQTATPKTNKGKLFDFSGAKSVIELPDSYAFNKETYSGEVARVQIVPNGKTQTTLFEMEFHDSENASQLLNIIVAVVKKGDKYVTALSALSPVNNYYASGLNRWGIDGGNDRWFRFDVAKDGAAYQQYNTAGDGIAASGSGDELKITDGLNLVGDGNGSTTSSIIVNYSDGEFTVNGYKIFDFKDETFLTAIGSSTSAVSGLFSSGSVNVKITINGASGHESNNSGSVNVISLFGTSLFNEEETKAKFKDTMAPTISCGEAFDSEKGVFEFINNSTFSKEQVLQFFRVKDVFDKNPTFDVKVYHSNHEEYTAETYSFSEGDYFKIIAKDKFDNETEKTFGISVVSVGIQDTYYVEMSQEATPYVVVGNLPVGYTYTVKLFNKDDVSYSDPITENYEYVFDKLGEYKVRINLEHGLNNSVFFSKLIVQDKQPPVMAFDESYKDEYSVNEEVVLIQPVVTDNNKLGNTSLEISVTFNGEKVNIVDGKFKLSQTGEYVITYVCKDESGNVASEYFVIENSGNDFLKPGAIFEKEYEQTYMVNERIEVITPIVSDNSEKTPSVQIEFIQGGEMVEYQDGVITFSKCGKVSVVYTVVDDSNNIYSVIKTFEIVDAPAKGCKGCKSDVSGYWALMIGVVGCVAIFLMKEKKGNE